ncbi:sphingosine hydroxylase [Obba rivulosa]|uniref:Sphingosine hydroxylase n=1 Tax=Obba rivulosa TaxID=1052685 RepID=A0A8E2DK23_9APHY|nr:sphingosine hydroxylase [Obba rivulosa]
MNYTHSSPFLAPAQIHYLSTNTPVYYSPRPSLLSWIPDHLLALAAPVVAYWIASLFFHTLDISSWKYLNKYRIHDSAEVQSRNRATRVQVLCAVLLQQLVQTLIGYWWMDQRPTGAAVDHLGNILGLAPSLSGVVLRMFGNTQGSVILRNYGAELLYSLYWWAIPVSKFFLGMFIIDTWQYFLHRGMHMNTYLYKKLHSVHHRLYVPYAYGALYNHPLEGLLLDTAGAGIAELVSCMSTREAILLFVISTLKTVDDHCGYSLPWDPLQLVTRNNADYHDIHHQVIGIKSNFSQPFFIHWDVILGTRMTRKDIEQRRQRQKAD